MQSTWQTVQVLGSATAYKSDDDLHLFCGMIDARAFLPLADIASGMAYLRIIAAANATQLLDFFDETYLSGSCRTVLNGNSDSRI